MKLLQISAFYRNDKPDGVGVTLTEDFGDLDGMLTIIQNMYGLMWREAEEGGELPALISDLRSQLTSLGLKKGQLTWADASIVIGNVWLLESRSHMVTDEYNGLQLAYV